MRQWQIQETHIFPIEFKVLQIGRLGIVHKNSFAVQDIHKRFVHKTVENVAFGETFQEILSSLRLENIYFCRSATQKSCSH